MKTWKKLNERAETMMNSCNRNKDSTTGNALTMISSVATSQMVFMDSKYPGSCSLGTSRSSSSFLLLAARSIRFTLVRSTPLSTGFPVTNLEEKLVRRVPVGSDASFVSHIYCVSNSPFLNALHLYFVRWRRSLLQPLPH